MRTRTTREPSTTGTCTETWNPGGVGTPVTSVLYSEFSTMSDVSTVDFRERLKEGEYINNPMSLTYQKVSHVGSWSYTRQQGSTIYRVNGNGSLYEWAQKTHFPSLGLPAFPSQSTKESAAMRSAQLRCLASMDKTPHAFLEDILTIRSTVHLLKGEPINNLWRLSKTFRKNVVRMAKSFKNRRKYVAAVKRTKNAFGISDFDLAVDTVWLSARFGIGPLVQSMLGILEVYNESIKPRPTVQNARGKEVFSYNTGGNQATGAGTFTRPYSYDLSYEARAVINYEISNPLNNWQFQLGLRTKDIPVGLWAVVPYSFMIDRVLDITSSIKGLMNLSDPSLKIRGASVTSKRRLKTTASFHYPPQAGWTNWNVSFDRRHQEDFVMVRDVWLPGPQDLIPPETLGGLVSSVTSAVDLLTLSHQYLAIRGKKK